MRAKPAFVVGLLLCIVAPLASDAGAGQAKCCNLAASFRNDLFPGGSGDEDFFTVPGGPPSVMILLDNSGSMFDFPQALKYPTLANGAGTCSITDYDDAVAARLTAGQHTFEQPFSFTNGNSNNPSWVTTGTGQGCQASGKPANGCLFKPSSFYKYAPKDGTPFEPNLHEPAEHAWTETGATESTDAQACTGLNTGAHLDACKTCLSNSGYYLYRTESGTLRGAFSGAFLNVFPPKYIQARRVLKELLSVDPGNPSASDGVRFGLATFASTNDGAALTQTLLPSCADADPTLDLTTRQANFVAARTTLIGAIDAVDFGTLTPLGMALFNIGQYYSDGAGSNGGSSQWLTWFPGASGPWQKTSTGTANSWWNFRFWNGASTQAGVTTSSVCWKCQQSSVVIVTDGAPKNDSNLPKPTTTSCSTDHDKLFDSSLAAACNGDFQRWVGGTLGASTKTPINCGAANDECGLDEDGSGQRNLLHLVAGFLHNNDLWPDATNSSMTGTQSVTTFTIGFNVDPSSTAGKLLQKTAELGGSGSYVNAQNADDLADAISSVVGAVINTATTFSVSNTSTLQAATAAQLFTARFRPLDRLSWEGHLYRFTLFNELALGCDPTKDQAHQTLIPATATTCGGKNPNLDGKLVGGLAACASFYIVDKNCDPVIEDSDGVFKVATFDATTHALTATTTDAVPFWDAGSKLSNPSFASGTYPNNGYRSADARTIFTVIDNDSSGGDGQFTSLDTLVPFDADTDAHVDALTPYLELSSTWCTSLFNRLGFTVPGTWGAADYRKCAKQVIWFIRGWDVLDEDDDGCAGPGGLGSTGVQKPIACTSDSSCSPSTSGACSGGKCVCASGTLGEQRDAPNGHWKLGDIFHSSPQAVDPPYNETLCDLGRGQTQCVATIHSAAGLTRETQTAIDVNTSNVDAYEQWRQATPTGSTDANRDRRRIVLAGGNDGMLHAFDAGRADKTATRDVFGSLPYDFGNGEELWAFIPPDLLPKLKYALDGHQYFVDGDIMVRDVWVDGGSNGTGTKDRTKQSDEFHTIAILSERSGGTQFVALDVTNPLVPSFRWSFPQLCSKEQNLVGQSWSDFSPRPPPIGPVKLALGGTAKDSLGRTFEERWIAMINGGYDQGLVRGRGVWMIDVWSGNVVWHFTQEDLLAELGSSTSAGMFPVAASPGLVDIGNADQAVLDSDGYFDTATWGDLGGQLWVARFKEPGDISSGTVSNWYAARAMEELRQSDGGQAFSQTLSPSGDVQYRSEFYRMTANIWEPTTASLRSFLGSGNRERLLSVGAACGPTNLMGCAQAGCNVIKLTDSTTIGSCQIDRRFQDNNDKTQHYFVDDSKCSSPTTPLDCTGGVKETITLNLEQCNGSSKKYQLTASMTCDSNGNCTPKTKVGRNNDLSTKNWPYTSHNRFYGVLAYSQSRAFSNQTSAVTFDGNRFSDVAVSPCPSGSTCGTLVNVTAASVDKNGVVTCDGSVVTNSTSTACKATPSDPGWFYEYGRKCPLASCSDPATPPWVDEKTGSGATVVGSCVDWNTQRPRGKAVTGAPCQFGSGNPLNITYLADAISGVPNSSLCGFQTDSTTPIYRASSRSGIAPPLDPTAVVTISSTGVVRQSLLQVEPGSLQSKDLAQRTEMSQPIYWLEVPRDLHTCRHVDKAVCE